MSCLKGSRWPADRHEMREKETHHLIDDNVATINVEFGKLLDQALCLVKAQELRYTNTDEGRQLWVLELGIYLLHCALHKHPQHWCQD
jgi:hypothetical protein